MKLMQHGGLREQWIWDEYPWEFYLVQSGTAPVGHHIHCASFNLALGPLVKKARGELFPLPSDESPSTSRTKNAQTRRCDGFTPEEVDSFLREWNRLAAIRQRIFDQGNVDWPARLLRQSNLLMRYAPDRRLRRIARLARLPPHLDLQCPDCIIYCICGAQPPYIGQCGVINGPRPPLQRFGEHCRKGKTLKDKYIGRQCRAHARAIKLGRMPSLPWLIAKHGMGCMTMYPIERVEPSKAEQRERFWDGVHAPTRNQGTPFGGVDRLIWELISDEREDSSEMKTLKARAELILNKGVLYLGIPTVIRFMADACGHLQTCLVNHLFRAVKRTVRGQWGSLLPRRWTFHVPSYEPHVHAKIQRFIGTRIAPFRIPDALRDWPCKCIGGDPFECDFLPRAEFTEFCGVGCPQVTAF